ncbi:MAG TPA: 2OG-Fe(II) oxygenase [Burkholderiaceae bacterium]|nr:2OG-Fe(II) oxygenase [Burkholderiaceae bacterium]
MIESRLQSDGHAMLPRLLAAEQCRALRDCYPHDDPFRSRVVMARHGFGRGEYKYFAYPLPELLQRLRETLYERLAGIANRWTRQPSPAFPPTLDAFLQRCHAAGQRRPTPLLLRYGPGDYNCLHQDLYGDHVFPLQVVMLLSRPGEEFEGGELVITRTRGDRQEAEVLPLAQGDAAIIAVNRWPERGPRGTRQVAMRHGVARVRAGLRHTAGLIFHDAA